MLGELTQRKAFDQVRLWLDESLVLTRRELLDTARDWRITIPIVLLTLIFPALMHITAGLAVDWVQKYGGAALISERTFPFMLMVVGFFPLSFSLIIALEAFVGEKERKSLEPLLATPLTNGQLYFAKMLASLIPPVLGSYLGISVYLGAMLIFRAWRPPLDLLVIVVTLTTCKAVVMVSGAVIISAQTTSVRAANLLASFIIIPMTLLVQAESIIMFWGKHNMLWWVVLILIVVDVLLVRMGMQLFNREEVLGREIDEMNLGQLGHTFKQFWARVEPEGTIERVTIGRIYRRDLPAIWRRIRMPTAIAAMAQLAGFWVGVWFAGQLPLPNIVFDPSQLSPEMFQGVDLGFLPVFSTGYILFHNLRVMVLATLLAIFSFGSLAIVVLMAPIAVIGFAAAEFAIWGYDPLLFLATFILPHGLFELPAAFILVGAALRLGATFITRHPRLTVTENWLSALADLFKVLLFVTLPLLIVAAIIEVNLTLRIVVWAYGGG
ncbi:MAG: stage II sporulation protein M [Thermoflexales bacterium]|nr:stage II sporulation protein M [Thermoflexales bacterium]